MYLADTADVVVGDIPSPGSHRVPFLDPDFHCGDFWDTENKLVVLKRLKSCKTFEFALSVLNSAVG